MIREYDMVLSPPWNTVTEVAAERGITNMRELNKKLGITTRDANSYMCGTRRIVPDLAYLLQDWLGAPAKFWLKLDALYWHNLMKAAEENYNKCSEEIRKEIEEGK